ncbi:MAG: T9SS type A sorting domain-containing protein [Bacteroidales bacterium]|nr:T9SS type A sorting domain-containing protein [Bacteroidales bacterium]
MKKIFTLLLIILAFPAFGVNITFQVSMKGSGMDLANGVYIVGTLNEWTFEAMTNDGDSLFSITKDLAAGDTFAYYYITSNSWDNYQNFREPRIPNECGDSIIVGWSGDRLIIVPSSPVTDAKVWGSCNAPGGQTSINNTFSESPGIKIYPNPAIDIIYIDISSYNSAVSIELIDLTGRVLKKLENQKIRADINLKNLPSNVYMIRISDGIFEELGRFIVQ